MISDRYLKDIKRELKKQYGEIPESWNIQLSVLSDDIKLYNQMAAAVEAEGVYDLKTHKKHPLLSSMKDIKNSLLKSINQFGLSAYAQKRLKQEDAEDAEDFVENLCS